MVHPSKFTTIASGITTVKAIDTIAENNELAFKIREQLIQLQEWVTEMSK